MTTSKKSSELLQALLFIALLATGARLHAQSTGVYVNSNNYVGIGTTTPSLPLDVKGANTVARFESNAASALIYFTPSGQKQWRMGAGDVNAGDFGLRNDTDGIVAFNINAAGNVGIGTTNPTNKLTVQNGPVIVRGDSNASWNYPAYYSSDTGPGGHTYAFGSRSGIGFSLSDETAAAFRFVISNSGNVGIGITNPQFPLDINGSGERITGGNGNATQLDLVQTNGGRDWALISWGSAAGAGSMPNKFSIYDNTLGAHRLVIDGNGNVGIGMASPGYMLDVAGQVHATSFVSSTQTYADFVFKPGYKLAPLSDVEASIKKEGHLPGIPGEEEAKAHGIDLTSMQVKLLQKIEELTLHQIEQQKLLEEQNRRIGQLEKENAKLRTGITTDASGL